MLIDTILSRNDACIDLLLDQEPLLNTDSNQDSTPLIAAVETGNIRCVEKLIEKGADVNLESMWSSTTPISKACETGNFDILSLLLNFGADPKQRWNGIHDVSQSPIVWISQLLMSCAGVRFSEQLKYLRVCGGPFFFSNKHIYSCCNYLASWICIR